MEQGSALNGLNAFKVSLSKKIQTCPDLLWGMSLMEKNIIIITHQSLSLIKHAFQVTSGDFLNTSTVTLILTLV